MKDTLAMKAIAVVTMTFLPATFVAVSHLERQARSEASRIGNERRNGDVDSHWTLADHDSTICRCRVDLILA